MAKWLWESQPSPFIEDLLSETYDLRRDPKERETEEATNSLKKWMGNNQEMVDDLMSFD